MRGSDRLEGQTRRRGAVAVRLLVDTPALSHPWFFLLCVCALAGLLCFFVAKTALAATTPPGFTDTLVGDNVPGPTALAFTPDGRMLVTTQPGKLRIYKDGTLLTDSALDLSGEICAQGERGLLGVAVDPEFATNNYIYLYHTSNEPGQCRNQVSRYTLSNGNTATFDKKLIETVYSGGATNHNAGDLHFGKDGYLYASIGDLGCDYNPDPMEKSGCAGANDAARDQHALVGKILRVTRDGEIPPDNPYQGSDSARCNLTGKTDPGKKCQETFAWGLRNPFRMAFDPNAPDTRFFINDVGQNIWEEVDEGEAGADYGWNCREGAHTNNTSGPCSPAPPNMVDPIHEYNHNTGCASITGGAFVPNGFWPAEYEDSYLYGDYVCGKIFRLSPDGRGGYDRSDFMTGLGGGSAVHLAFGPHNGGQALYYTTYHGGGEIRRVAYTGFGDQAPTAAVNADPTSGLTPLTVDFDGSGSKDKSGRARKLTYLWNFGDGTPTETTTSPTTSHTYEENGTYTATLRVRDKRGAESAPTTVRIDAGNIAPTPEIEAPTPDALFHVGQEITLQGSATDAEDGSLAESSLTWEVIRHHNGDHTHPVMQPTTGNNLTFTAPPPEDLFATGDGNYLEIRLTATDSRGTSRTVTQRLQPRRVNVTFETVPKGRNLEINGAPFKTPETLTSWEGYEFDVFAPDQSRGRKTFVFDSWSDGEAARHKITTPASPATYTATFERQP